MAVDQMLQAGVPSEVYDPLAKQLSVKLNRELLEREGSARVVYLLLEKCPSFLQTYTPEVQPILWGMVAKEAENGFRARQLTTLLAHNCLSSEDARRVKAVAEKLPIR
ncbi:hypothetical protein ADEAN_000487000 [Angomonas deanei]|uniref:Uncharacterized protein n=1 Tax=Angomonas deanei TaxID=59799 RepID=A0A7G2CGS8_9TRYP|nr:hypothetical protein ADEAN_000487000 [Angomonas deanei]